MQISGSIPFHVARAYGVPARQAPAQVPAATPATPARPVDARAAEPDAKLGALIGGRVPGTVDFSSTTSSSPSAEGAFQLYTRAADKIEAAVSVQIGRTIDVKG